MSVQTHRTSMPPSGREVGLRRWLAGLRYRFENPNPVWIRELKQSARLQRTPIILAVVTGMMALLITSVGGVLSTTAPPAQVGVGIYHTFFSLAFVVVTWLGPAVAAATIASEKSGRTWESLQLTGLSPARITRGKFLSSFTYISLYIVMLAPVGALAFLFGGVTPAEVLLGFALLFLFAALAVAFGLAVSSKFASPVVAVLVTLSTAVPGSLFVYLVGGVALSFAAREQWPSLAQGAPVWLPAAISRAEFGLDYVVLLLGMPLVSLGLPGWLFYEITLANMAATTDDRSTRLRAWTVVSGLALAATGVLAAHALDELDWGVTGIVTCWLFFVFVAFLIAGEPLAPSTRVQGHWARHEAGALRRAIGPGIGPAGVFSCLLALVCLGAAALGTIPIAADQGEVLAIVVLAGYALGFSWFLIGLAVWTRSRAEGPTAPRALLLGVLFVAALGPYIAMAIAGIVSNAGERVLLLTAPSPAFPFTVLSRLRSAYPSADSFVYTAAGAAFGWGLLGLGLLVLGRARARRRVRKDRRARRDLEQPREAAPAGAA